MESEGKICDFRREQDGNKYCHKNRRRVLKIKYTFAPVLLFAR